MAILNRRSVLGAAVGLAGGTAAGASLSAYALEPDSQPANDLEAIRVAPDDHRYPDLVRGDNNRWVAEPDEVVLARTTQQVIDAVQKAVDDGKRLTVRSGGHCYEDFVFNSEVEVVLDLSEMNAVSFDEEEGAFAIESGANLGHIYDTLYRNWAVTIPGGSCPTVAAGGHITGGGYGVLSRTMGLIVDHLHAVEVVTIDQDGTASATVATRDSSDEALQDLWWAHTGGGGGNFGIATRFWMRSPDASSNEPSEVLPSPPSQVWIARFGIPWEGLTKDGFTKMLQNFGAWHENNSAADSPGANLFSRFFVMHQTNEMSELAIQVDAAVSGVEDLIDGFIGAVTEGIGVDAVPMERVKLPWLRATRWSGMFGGDGTGRADFKSAYMKTNFPKAHIEAMYEHLTREDYANPFSLIQMSSYGGRTNTVDADATAEPHRDSIMKLMFLAGWSDSSEDDTHIAWLRDIYQDVYADTGGVPVPDDVTDGCFVNYCDIDLSSDEFNTSDVPWHELYYKDNYARLRKVKTAWDPMNIFQHGQSIEPE